VQSPLSFRVALKVRPLDETHNLPSSFVIPCPLFAIPSVLRHPSSVVRRPSSVLPPRSPSFRAKRCDAQHRAVEESITNVIASKSRRVCTAHHCYFIIRHSLFDAEGSPMANSIFPLALLIYDSNIYRNTCMYLHFRARFSIYNSCNSICPWRGLIVIPRISCPHHTDLRPRFL